MRVTDFEAIEGEAESLLDKVCAAVQPQTSGIIARNGIHSVADYYSSRFLVRLCVSVTFSVSFSLSLSIGVRGGVSGVSGDTPVGLETSGSLESS